MNAALVKFTPDLAVLFAVGLLAAGIVTAGEPRSLGSCSCSLYLTRETIVIAAAFGLVRGRVTSGTPVFLVLAANLLPVAVCLARMFAAVFGLPFQRHRGWIPAPAGDIGPATQMEARWA